MNSGDRTNPPPLRLFVAIQLPAAVRAALGAAQAELRGLMPPRSTAWTRPENLHLTLRFLGKVSAARLGEVKTRLHAALAGFGPLNLNCERLGCFPDLRFLRVIWAWIHDAAERLPELHRQVDAAVREFSERTADERFVGHVTLARPKLIKRTDAERLARFLEGAANRQFGNWRCAEVELVSSELAADGARYTTLDVFPL
jgi:2'-5' RNA ligase